MSSARAIVAGHGDFAAGLLSAVLQITGRDDVFVGLTNQALSAQDVDRALRAAVAAGQVRVIFTDLPAGSCTVAARRLQREDPQLIVVTGVNLATLLDFVFSESPDDVSAAAAAAEKGRAALAIAGASPTRGGETRDH